MASFSFNKMLVVVGFITVAIQLVQSTNTKPLTAEQINAFHDHSGGDKEIDTVGEANAWLKEIGKSQITPEQFTQAVQATEDAMQEKNPHFVKNKKISLDEAPTFLVKLGH